MSRIAQYRRYNFFLPPEVVEQVKLLAEARGVTTAEIVRRALEAYIRAWKAKNGQ
jgi:predicted DNA-binding protein